MLKYSILISRGGGSLKKEEIASKIAELFKVLKVLETEQAGARAAVRDALQTRNISEIQRLSTKIRDNRRKPRGLRELNTKIRELELKYWS